MIDDLLPDINDAENALIDGDIVEEELSPLDKLTRLASVEGDITEYLSADLLKTIATDVIEDYETDKADRRDWEETVKEALKAASQENKGEKKTYPWPNAANISYPLLTTAALQFNARALGAIVKGDEAVSVKVVGRDAGRPMVTEQGPLVQSGQDGQPQVVWAVPPGAKAARAQRVRDYMNTVIFYRMDDWETDTDALLLQLPIVGCVFRKVWWDSRARKQAAAMVPALRLFAPKGAKSCKTAPRLTEEIPDVYPHDIIEKMRVGFYRDIDLYGEDTDGRDRTAAHSELRMLLEQHRLIDLDEDGLPEPYIVTLDRESEQVLRVEPNFGPDDVKLADDGMVLSIEPGQFYIKYDFFPHPEGKFYGIGLGHLLKQIGGVINTAINQMIDAGTAQVAGGGFIGSGLNLQSGKRSSALRFMPGEYKTVNASGAQLREAIYERTWPGPSQIMYNVLDMMLSAAKDISSVKDVITGEASNNGQVGTTLALIEQGLQVFTAIYKRVYRSLKDEFGLLFRNIGRHGGEEAAQDYDAVLDDPEADFASDFNERDMDIRPVSDPASVTRMQKMARAQFLGGFVNLPWVNGEAVTKRMWEAADVEDVDELLRPVEPPQPDPKDVAQAKKYEAGAVLDLEKAQTERVEREKKKAETDAAALDNFAKAFGMGHAIGLA